MSAPHADAKTAGDVIDQALRTARGLLPDQAPIGVFIHHNTLHALQHLPFEEAVPKGAALVGARAWPEMDGLREAWRTGRIEDVDVNAELTLALGDRAEAVLPLGLTRRALSRALMQHAIDVDDAAGALFLGASDPAFQAALEKVKGRPPAAVERAAPRRHRDVLVACGAEDIDEGIHSELVRLGLAFLDLGQARTRMPGREEGFLKAAARVLSSAAGRSPQLPELAADFARIVEKGLSPREVVRESLDALGVDDAAAHDFLVATALALPGITGMFSRLELHPEEADAPASLMEFLAVRLVLQRRAVERAARPFGLPTSWASLKEKMPAAALRGAGSDAHLLAGLAKAAGRGADALLALKPEEVSQLFDEAATFPRPARNYLLFLAFERALRRRVLTGMVRLREKTKGVAVQAARPKAEVMFCIDEREESIRRAIEELDPSVETLGAAGFFGMAIDYKGLDDHAAAAYCPVVVTPAHRVHESPQLQEQAWHTMRAKLLGAWHGVERGVSAFSRTLFGGGVASGFGPFAFALAVGRVNAPRASLRAWGWLTSSVARTPATKLLSVRNAEDLAVGTVAKQKPMGFSVDEAADRVSALLKSVGMMKRQARLVVVLGHGSTSLNNPHESAHDCGACGGRRGGANARLFAELANRPDVRAKVAARGVTISEDTWFVGGIHDTSDDGIGLSDLSAVPPTHTAELADLVQLLNRARMESARERCRRFHHAPLGLSPERALAHVEGRASHLAQPRPEYGHCTNAVAVVGRRYLTRGLHLDRRAFLINYDPAADQNDAIIERVLAAVGPVGAGINLEYWFSAVDNEVYGCGTKLPHNVTGLLGVMNGHQGDLRTGLPLQMVELHEAVRLLLVVEASPESLLAVAGRQAEVRELVVNRWVQLVSVHPETGELKVFEGERGFVPFVPDPEPLPEVRRSHDWHGASREFVNPAIVTASLPTVQR